MSEPRVPETQAQVGLEPGLPQPRGAASEKPEAQESKLGVRGVLVLLLTNLVFVSVRPAQVRERAYPAQGTLPPHDVDSDQAEFLYKQQREDSAHTDDKAKQLMTLSAALTTAIGVFARDVQPRWLVAMVAALLIACVFLCLTVLDVRTSNVPTLEAAGRADLKEQWGRDLLWSYFANRGRHAYRVDQFRAAGRYFTLALLITPIITLFSEPKPEPTDNVVRAIERVEHAISTQLERLPNALRKTARVAPTPPPASSSTPAASGGAPAAKGNDGPGAASRPRADTLAGRKE